MLMCLLLDTVSGSNNMYILLKNKVLFFTESQIKLQNSTLLCNFLIFFDILHLTVS